MTGVFVRTDRLGQLPVQVASIELGNELEDGCPRHVIPRDNGALHRRRTAPAREQREVQVDPAESRDSQERFSNQAAVGNNYSEIRLQSPDPLGSRARQSICLEHRKCELHRRRRYGRRG